MIVDINFINIINYNFEKKIILVFNSEESINHTLPIMCSPQINKSRINIV